jgi:hypothetical protein
MAAILMPKPEKTTPPPQGALEIFLRLLREVIKDFQIQ